MKRFWIGKVVMMIIFFILAVVVFGVIVMSLWNALLPAIFGVKSITLLQAFGILVLSKILFGGFGHRRWGGGRGYQWKQNMQNRMAAMTPEEKEKFKSEWKNRCGGRWGRYNEAPESAAE